MSPLALVTGADLAAEAAELAQERAAAPRPAAPPTADDQAQALERQAAALRRLHAAQLELAGARLQAAQAGVAQWCTRCDEVMPASRPTDLCSRCTSRVTRTRWQRETRAAGREEGADHVDQG